MRKSCLCLFATLLAGLPVLAQAGEAPTPAAAATAIERRVDALHRMDGYLPLYWDEHAGKMLLEIPQLERPFLFSTGLSAGLGSNDFGLDRNQGSQGRVVRFQRTGPRVLLIQDNHTFRSSSPDPLERKAVEDSFAKSVLWGFDIIAETQGRVLVDATDFFLRDVHGVATRLRPGNYRLDRTRSAFHLPGTRNFPRNTEVDMLLTFVREAEGGGGGGGPVQGPGPIPTPRAAGEFGRAGGLFSGSIASVTPSADAVTLREHVSFVELPDDQYRPRLDDPRAGYNSMLFLDYSQPMAESIQVRYLRRHRLQKKDPAAAISEPVEPIRYWVDPGAPPDIRQALLDGARWWNAAFEAAGFRNAFRVEVLPADADPMDIRYNMINWVHRSTRGWSYGGSVTDPRTGEIIRGMVTLGSLRDRQDYLIFEGLLSPYDTGTERPAQIHEAALARIRQLSAHEIGHTLGLGHNYYDSTRGWISVMDYPHPLETLRPDGAIDISAAYAAQIGDWDKVSIDYGYREFAPGTDEAAQLRRILDEAWDQDLRYLTNQDISLHPRADQWSNGVDQAGELERLMKVRRVALDRLGERTLRLGAPLATLEEPLVPIFMYHRYAVESTASMLAGQDYIYAMRGDGRTPVKWESAASQRHALQALAATLEPAELTVPQGLLGLIPPRPPGWGVHRELFPRTTGGGFDPLAPATVAADVTIGFVFQAERAARMVAQHAVDPALPGLEEVIDHFIKATFDAAVATPYEAEVRRAIERVLVDRLSGLAAAAQNAQVRAVASYKLQRLAERLRASRPKHDADAAQHALLAADIRRFLERPAATAVTLPAAPSPPGAPIGDAGRDWLARP